ncbi:MAG TPA: hypothetical protein VN819_05110, partial [Thermoplasmata archaeon]|nr:hypothetical protein [Thermoplasmata archaeon]
MTEPPTPPSNPVISFAKTLDTKTIEVLALSVFRTMFADGLRLPLKVEGMMDMDVVIRDSNVILNLNEVHVNVPELLIWRITFAYQGKPVIEYGRGIKNDTKIHIPQLCFLLVAMWREKRRQLKAKA